MTVSSTAEFVGCDTVSVGPNVVLDGASDVAFSAGEIVRFLNGVTFEAGAQVRVGNDPSL